MLCDGAIFKIKTVWMVHTEQGSHKVIQFKAQEMTGGVQNITDYNYEGVSTRTRKHFNSSIKLWLYRDNQKNYVLANDSTEQTKT